MKDRHHRRPKSRGGNGDPRNISFNVDRKEHEAWHTLFKNYDPIEIAEIINKVWLDPDWRFQAQCLRRR